MSSRNNWRRRVSREMRPIAERALEQGWTIDWSTGKHQVWTSPEGGRVRVPCTPSDRRSERNTIAELRRMGLDLGRQ